MRTERQGSPRLRNLAMQFVAAAALAWGAAIASGVAAPVGAEAPAIATVLADAPLLQGPDAASEVIRTVREGTDVELTGSNAVGYLQVNAGGDTGWMSTDVLSISAHRPVSTAVTPNGAAIYDAPLPDASVLGRVPAGGVVILTGAHVDTWVAGSYEGVGGWIIEADLDVPYDADGTAH